MYIDLAGINLTGMFLLPLCWNLEASIEHYRLVSPVSAVLDLSNCILAPEAAMPIFGHHRVPSRKLTLTVLSPLGASIILVDSRENRLCPLCTLCKNNELDFLIWKLANL